MQFKKLTFLLLFLGFSTAAMAQMEIGIQFSPTISGNRFIAEDRHEFEKSSNTLRLGVGVVGDYFFSNNYAFSSGLMYRSKGSKISYTYMAESGDGQLTPTKETDELTVQYLEIPVTLKLFTNEVAPDIVVYFQVGGALGTKVSAQVDQKKVINGEKTAKRFNVFETSAVLGTGAEMQLGQSTKLFGGVTYLRGLTNIDSYYKKQLNDKNIAIKNNGVSIDVGIKF
ncbi:PorT family protein [Pontibacter sp. JH31]|uniref:PorT family protein n=1 Tax=Pontibacter aquaedesilientis TaxID=2766980 RepID=A0ABR7XM96_9BACT|nr:porin family protein [Pontibacter aquaedesilientis]MBD1398546.1 PorT family protein [Pontibacter aquaedesilientis]